MTNCSVCGAVIEGRSCANSLCSNYGRIVQGPRLKKRWRFAAWGTVLALAAAVVAFYVVPLIRLSSARIVVAGQPLEGKPVQLKVDAVHPIEGEFRFSTPNIQPDGKKLTFDTVYLTFVVGSNTDAEMTTARGRLTDDGYGLTFEGRLPLVRVPEKGVLRIGITDFREKNQAGGFSTRPVFEHPIEFVR
jgi:hypothetical protein